MYVDKDRFKELKKEGGGIKKLELTATIKVIEGPDLKPHSTCNFNIYPNGLFFDYVFSDKIYFPISALKDVECTGKIIKIELEIDEETCYASFEIDSIHNLNKTYNILRNKLGLPVEKINVFKEKEKEKAAKRERNIEIQRRLTESRQMQRQVKKEKSKIVCCPKCGSTSVTANKKGFGLAKGALGVATMGAYGVLAAGIGKNKIIITCLNCGHKWKPGKK